MLAVLCVECGCSPALQPATIEAVAADCAGGMENWPALGKWQDVQYLRTVAGPRTVPVEVLQGLCGRLCSCLPGAAFFSPLAAQL